MSVCRPFVRRTVLTAAACLMPLVTVKAQSGSYVSRLGSDTLSVERFTRTGSKIEGQLVLRSPSTVVVSYSLVLNADGTVASMEQGIARADGTPAPGQPTGARMRFVGDTVIREITANGQTTERRNAVPRGTLPALGLPWKIYEMGIAEARRNGTGTYYTMSANPQATAPTKWAVTFAKADSVDVDYFGAPIAVTLDRAGLIVRADGIRSTNKAVVSPAGSVDVATIATAWAARDAAGQAMGMASPRDTVRGTVGGAALLVDYGRPAKRGRVVWGTVVPFGEVWRLGANAATQFTTDKELEIGGSVVPAGSYTLWLIPAADGGTLIINKQTKQWGTQYDAAHDLARVAVRRSRASLAAEKFTTTIEGDELRFSWDDATFAVKVRAR